MSVAKGRPLVVRRRGAAIRPVYTKLEEILSGMPELPGFIITQRSLPRSGKWVTDFFAQVGRKSTPLSTLTYREDPEVTVIIAVEAPSGPPVLCDEDLQAIRDIALRQ